MLVLNPVDNSVFADPRPSVATKSERMLFAPSPPEDAETLPEFAEEVLLEVERDFRGTCHD